MSDLATPDQLPAVLVEPPWLRAKRAAPPITLALPPLSQPPRLTWSDEGRQKALNSLAAFPWMLRPFTAAEIETCLDEAGIRAESRAALLAGRPATPGDFIDPPPARSVFLYQLLRLPDSLAIGLFNAVPATRWLADGGSLYLSTLLARHGEAVAPGLLACTTRWPVQGLRAGQWLEAPELAVLALRARRRLKTARQVATAWLLTHPQTTSAVVLRQLLGEQAEAREDAVAALHDLAAAGLRPVLDATARELGPAADAAWQAARDADPLLRLPARIPQLPAYIDPAKLQRPRLKAGGAALPDDAVRHLALMLAISAPESPYAGLSMVQAACTAASLAEFAWSLFEAWWAAGAPSAGAWALPALGLLGDIGTVHRMGARVLRLAKENAKHRAVAMVDLLAAQGSDAALMHLDHIATRCKSPAVCNRATAQIDAVAEQRGLSRIELADRLVPTLGLDESRVLDFGPRQFHIGLDESLLPFVRDAEGVRLKDLPKPRLSDDRGKAEAAVLRYKQLKTDLKTLAKVQLARLEQAMVTRRRWAPDDFTIFFVQHPLTREIAARLLWGVWSEAGELLGACRIAEDGTLADARDEAWTPPADARLGIAHPIELPAELMRAFGDRFADYRILQPFPQLARETFALTPEEAAGTRLLRVQGQDVATGALIGLIDRAWQRGPTGDGGGIDTLVRPFGTTGLQAALFMDPGMHVTQLSFSPRQILGQVQLRDAESREQPFSVLDAVAVSELLRDLYRLAPSAAP